MSTDSPYSADSGREGQVQICTALWNIGKGWPNIAEPRPLDSAQMDAVCAALGLNGFDWLDGPLVVLHHGIRDLACEIGDAVDPPDFQLNPNRNADTIDMVEAILTRRFSS